MPIPIENIYYLLCYAWDTLEEKDQVNVNIDGNTKLLDLLAKVLVNGTRIILKRGLEKRYKEEVNELAGIRGKMEVAQTIKANLLHKQRTICSYDEFSADILHNQILVTTLYHLLQNEDLDKSLKSDIRNLLNMLPDVKIIQLRGSLFKLPKFHRNNRFYAFLIHICELIFESGLPSEQQGKWGFADFSRDEKKMNRLFELFIFNFYQKEQNQFKVRREQIEWRLVSQDMEQDRFLPKMRTDITLENENQKTIIDAKYYQETMSVFYDKEKIKSINLYQLFSYLIQQENGTERNASTRGILLYPTIITEYDLHYRYGNHEIWIKTVNLNQAWKGIEDRLLHLVG